MMPRQQCRRYALLSVNGNGQNHKCEDEETERGVSIYRGRNFSSSTDRRTRSDATDPRQKKLAPASSQEYDAMCQTGLVGRWQERGRTGT
jgi:hypothetical protein